MTFVAPASLSAGQYQVRLRVADVEVGPRAVGGGPMTAQQRTAAWLEAIRAWPRPRAATRQRWQDLGRPVTVHDGDRRRPHRAVLPRRPVANAAPGTPGARRRRALAALVEASMSASAASSGSRCSPPANPSPR